MGAFDTSYFLRVVDADCGSYFMCGCVCVCVHGIGRRCISLFIMFDAPGGSERVLHAHNRRIYIFTVGERESQKNGNIKIVRHREKVVQKYLSSVYIWVVFE